MKKYLFLALLVGSIVFGAGEKVRSSATEKSAESIITKNVQQAKVTFIELGSVNCVPCQMMVPVMEAVEKEYPDVQVVFHDVWTKAGEPYAQQYNIRGIPTQIFLDKNRNEYYRHAGYFPKEELFKILDEGLKK